VNTAPGTLFTKKMKCFEYSPCARLEKLARDKHFFIEISKLRT
jgi:hypothetical protein